MYFYLFFIFDRKTCFSFRIKEAKQNALAKESHEYIQEVHPSIQNPESVSQHTGQISELPNFPPFFTKVSFHW
jgi:hypothetical protein